jgi:glutathione S-transferase
VLRVHRIPFSTNVDRVAIACGLKGLTVAWVDHDPDDRSGIVALSGQPLVPVLELDGEVLTDSPEILRRIDLLVPEPPLWPRDEPARARAEVFVAWFNGVWKGPPNRLAEGRPADGDAEALAGSRDLLDGLLAAGDWLLGGDAPTIADVVAFPFFTYGRGVPAGDTDPFHAVLASHLTPDPHPRLAAWLARCDTLPRS